MLNEWFTQRERIQELQTQIEQIGNEKGIEAQIKKLTDDLGKIKEKLASSLNENDEKEFKKLKNQLQTNEQQVKILTKDISCISALKDFTLLNNIDTAIAPLSQDSKNTVEAFYTRFKQDTLKVFHAFVDEQVQAIIGLTDRLSKQNDEILSNEIYKRGIQFSTENKAYFEREEQLKQEKTSLAEVKKLNQEQKTLIESKKAKQANIIAAHLQYCNKLLEISSNLQTKKDDVEISAEISFATERFNDILSNSFNQRAGTGKDYVEYVYKSGETYKTTIVNMFEQIENGKIILKSINNVQSALISIFSENFFSLNYKVYYDGDGLDLMSEGKKAFIILRLLLDFTDAKYPILIDQPEDDLDNRAIYDQLVMYLRNKKKQRQIIIATHNPNIVVGADAELVVVANQNGVKNKNQNDKQFEYVEGSLENTHPYVTVPTILLSQGIREHVCEILEGGIDAFKKREEKYNIK
jgi:predicted ATPase/regulator of replication initiation timing